jgi:hypothetical protein
LTVGVYCLGNQLAGAVAGFEINDTCYRLAATSQNFVHGCARLAIGAIGDDDARAFRRKAQGTGLTYPLCRSGHNHNLSCESIH